MNILLVDDDFPIVSCIANLLIHDHKVRITTNGLEALNAFKVVHYNVVITNIEMPKMNGIELLKTIREKDKRAYVIVITGNLSEEYESDAKRYGAYAFFTKPLNMNRLMDTLNLIEHEVNHSKNAPVE